MVILPVWFNKPLAGGYIRVWQIMAKKLEFDLKLILGPNGAYMPKLKTFTPGFAKQVPNHSMIVWRTEIVKCYVRGLQNVYNISLKSHDRVLPIFYKRTSQEGYN